MSFMSLLLVLLSGGGNDLLDYVHSETYWKSKGVAVSVDQLIAELTPPDAQSATKLIRELGAEDPAARDAAAERILKVGPAIVPQLQKAADGTDREAATRAAKLVEQLTVAGKAAQVRRLMSIRTLGELKKPEAVRGLKTLLDSKEPFVAEYAAKAITSIEGKPGMRPIPTAARRAEDLNLLPAKVDVVGQFTLGSGGNSTVTELLAGMKQALPAGDDHPLAQISKEVTALAEQFGNIRLETLTAGVFSNAPNAPGYGIFVVQGNWDADAVVAMATAVFGATVETVDGLRVLRSGKTGVLIVASDRRLVLLEGDQGGELPVAATVAAMKKNAGDFVTNAAIAKLLAGVDQKADAWIATVITDGLRQVMPQLTPLDTAWVTVHRTGDALDLKCGAQGVNAEAVKALVDEMQQQATQSANLLAGSLPAMKPIVDFLRSVHVATEDGKVLGDAKLEGGAKLFQEVMSGLSEPVKVDVIK